MEKSIATSARSSSSCASLSKPTSLHTLLLTRSLLLRWKESTAVNTIHSLDFASAAVAIAEWTAKNGASAALSQAGEDLPTTLKSNDLVKDVAGAAKKEDKVRAAVFTVVDDGQTTQKEIAKVIEEVVGVEAGFHGSIISSFAKLNMGDVLEDVNDKVNPIRSTSMGLQMLTLSAPLQHLEGWSALLTASNPPISTTIPISPNTVRRFVAVIGSRLACADSPISLAPIISHSPPTFFSLTPSCSATLC